jgi:hypothetical protein
MNKEMVYNAMPAKKWVSMEEIGQYVDNEQGALPSKSSLKNALYGLFNDGLICVDRDGSAKPRRVRYLRFSNMPWDETMRKDDNRYTSIFPCDRKFSAKWLMENSGYKSLVAAKMQILGGLRRNRIYPCGIGIGFACFLKYAVTTEYMGYPYEVSRLMDRRKQSEIYRLEKELGRAK